MKQAQHFYEFGAFRLDTKERRLLHDGLPILLPPKAFETLVVLVERGGHLVEKGELMQAVWPDSFVEEGNLSYTISLLRKALQTADAGARWIETVPKRGYRFTDSVSVLHDGSAPLIIEKHLYARIVTEEEETNNGDALEAATPAPEVAEMPQRVETQRLAAPVRRGTTARAGVIIISCALLASLLAAGAYYWKASRASRRPAGALSVKSIAVLPFKDFGAVGDDDRLGPGLADVLITRLSVLKGVSVRPTSAVLKFDGQDSVAAGRRLEVDAVLEGSIYRDNGRVRVTARLVAVNDRAIIWGAQFDEQPKDLFAIQDALSKQVAQALVSDLSDVEARMIAKRPTESIEAYQHYMKGRYFWNKRTAADAEKAIAHFEQAIAIDLHYALAYSGLADCYALRSVLPPGEALPKAKAAALKALELDDTLAEAHASLASVKQLYGFDSPGAEREYKRAIELNPNYALAHGWYSMLLTQLGRFDEGAVAARRAQELDPTSPSLHIYAAWNFYHSRQFDRSIEEVRRAVELDPNARTAYIIAAYAYAAKGMSKEAIAEAEKAKSVSINHSDTLGVFGYVYAVAGRAGEAREVLAELKELSGRGYVSSFHMARIHAGLGETAPALNHLEQTYREHNETLFFLNVDPAFDNLRDEPRFQELSKKLGLEP